MKVGRISASCFIGIFFILFMNCSAGELPMSFRVSIEKAVEEYTTACKNADERISKAFDGTIEQIRKNPQFKPEQKQSHIEAITTEKANFDKHGTIPFSMPMRQPANQYLTSIDKVRTQAAKAYDRAIDHLQVKAKDDAAASTMTEEKKKVLAPKTIGTWECTGTNFRHNFTRHLKSDGTITGTNEGTWRFDGEKMVFRVEGYIETCRVGTDGITFTASNMNGLTFTGKLVFPQAGP
ncbi:MAG: hypothetical protein H7062_24210 [Candidatus Saccharimonas sp.]|nr:hypothetical protein [Planctomycetaceae bacterium]